MITIQYNKEVGKRVEQFVSTIDTFKRASGCNGNSRMQITGFYAEAVTKLWMGFSMDEAFSFETSGFDGGVDFSIDGTNFDVKCKSYNNATEPKPFHQTFVQKAQVDGKNYSTDVYIFTTLNKSNGELCIAGTMTKEQLRGSELRIKGQEYTAGREVKISRGTAYNPFFKDMDSVHSTGAIKTLAYYTPSPAHA
jgi:hypothetical protein